MDSLPRKDGKDDNAVIARTRPNHPFREVNKFSVLRP
jgi:hypothetical protein